MGNDNHVVFPFSRLLPLAGLQWRYSNRLHTGLVQTAPEPGRGIPVKRPAGSPDLNPLDI
jgi:hypothetical protein